jgi:hypothetical protein
VMLLNLWQAFQKQRVELKQMAVMAPSPELKQLADAIETAGLKLLKRIMRTFETISDVDAYLAEVKGFEELTGQMPPELQRGMQGLTQMLQQAVMNRGPEGSPESPAPGSPPNGTGTPPPIAEAA